MKDTREPFSVAAARRLFAAAPCCSRSGPCWPRYDVARILFLAREHVLGVPRGRPMIAAVYLTRRGALQLDARPWKQDAPVSLFLLGLALAGGLLSLLAMRPDQDDVGYSSRTVYFLETPEHALRPLLSRPGASGPGARVPAQAGLLDQAPVGLLRLRDRPVLPDRLPPSVLPGRRSVARGLVPGRVPFRAQARRGARWSRRHRGLPVHRREHPPRLRQRGLRAHLAGRGPC